MTPNNEETTAGPTPEEIEKMKADVDAAVDEAMNTTQQDLKSEFLFGWVGVPRFPLFHSILFLIAGAVLFLVQLVRAVDMHALKLAMEQKGKMPEGQASIMLWPTILCLFMSYILYRRYSLRRMVISVKLNGLFKGYVIETKDAEDVAIAVRKTVAGALLAVATFSILFLLQFFLITFLMDLYIKYVV